MKTYRLYTEDTSGKRTIAMRNLTHREAKKAKDIFKSMLGKNGIVTVGYEIEEGVR